MTQARPERAAYGYDAPGIMLGLLATGTALVAAGATGWAWLGGAWQIGAAALCLTGLVPFVLGVMMVLYALYGKTRTRDHILDLARLSGATSLLDIGTGAGLLLVGAAKGLPHGHATGIDIWAAKDLSDNSADAAARNARIEGVTPRVTIRTADARALPFADASFDRVLSLLCLHNIEPKPDQSLACQEIARVLKPGGRVVIGDYVPTHSYAKELAAAGLTVRQSQSAIGVAWSLMWVLVADKPAR